MNPILKNSLIVLLGFAIGSIVNMALVTIGGSIIAIPEGVDPNDINSINENMHLYEAKHFIFPFLAHALGTLIGAFIVAKYAASAKFKLAMLIGLIFLVGGITACMMIKGPMWFAALDLIAAYLPMAWLGHRLASK